MLDTQTISELWESSTQSMWPRTGKFTAGSNQQNLIDFAESVAQKVSAEKQSLRGIVKQLNKEQTNEINIINAV